MTNFPDSTRPSVYWQPTCYGCHWPYGVDIYLDVPLSVGTQCARCLNLLNMSELADQMLAYWRSHADQKDRPIEA